MTDPIVLDDALRRLKFLYGRTPSTPLSEESEAFANLGSYRGGELFVGSFSGESPWERHPGGDELVHVLHGRARLTLLTSDGEILHELSAGMIFVVPEGHWHRFEVDQFVTVLTITPPPTEHSAARPAPAV